MGCFDAAFRFLFERVQHIDSRAKANGVNGAVGVSVEILDKFYRTATEAFQQLCGWRMLSELKRFYYDTAQTSNKAAMSALAAIIPVSRIVFGTDFPYRTSIDHVKGLREAGVFTDAQLMDIERGNALKLLPRLAS